VRIVVTTPSGHVGRVVVEQLLATGDDVVVTSRHPSRIVDAVARGARLVEGSIDDARVLATAFDGADALLWVTPPAYERADFVAWVARGAQSAAGVASARGVRRGVVLSSAGAQAGAGAGPIGALLAVETAFQRELPDVTVLRAGPFMENFLHDVATIAATSTIYAPLPATRADPYVATRDVAAAAVEVLRGRAWTGHRILGVHGPDDVSPSGAAAILGDAIGREVRYHEVTLDQTRHAMSGAGMPAHAVELMIEMYAAIRAGTIYLAEPRNAAMIGTTSFRQLARDVLAPAIHAAARG
jgi:uncharacterized protein YbjT (DUF2867 family)